MRSFEIKKIKQQQSQVRYEKKYTKKMPEKWGIKFKLLLKKMKKLGYRPDEEGFCYGIASVAIHAVLINRPDQFDRDLYQLRRSKIDEPFAARAFCEAVICIQDAEKYALFYDFFPSLAVQNMVKTLPFFMSKELEKAGGPAEAAIFSGIYKVKELEILFSLLREVLLKNPHPVGFLFEDQGHAIAVYFHLIQQKWCCVDLRKLPTRFYASDLYIAKSVANALSCDVKMTVICVKVITTADCLLFSQQAFGALFSHPQWQKLHKPVLEKKPYFFKLLHITSFLGDVKTVQALLDAKTDPDRPIINHQSPLILACIAGHMPIVNLLIQYGARVSLRHGRNFSALFYAKRYGHDDIAKRLISKNAKLTDEEKDMLEELDNEHQHRFAHY